MAKAKLLPDLSYLKTILKFDPETGLFHWLVRRGRAAPGQQAGCINAAGYVAIRVAGIDCYAHRLAWLWVHGECPEFLDHIDTVKSHNWIGNLRPATKVSNGCNRVAPCHNTSGFKGVSYAKRERRWRANISVNKRQFSLGYFLTKEEAAEAYRKAALKYHGEYAKI